MDNVEIVNINELHVCPVTRQRHQGPSPGSFCFCLKQLSLGQFPVITKQSLFLRVLLLKYKWYLKMIPEPSERMAC